MVISAQSWALIYVIHLLIPSLALGALAMHVPRFLGGTRMSRFLIGFTTTPFLIALWTLVLAAVFPGAPRFLFYATPSIISLVPLVLYGRHTPGRLFREWRRARRTCINTLPIYFSYVCAAMLMILVTSTLIANAKAQFINHDALAHLSVSLPFAEARSISAIPDFRATIDEPTMSQSHTYLYSAFLAEALMTSGSDILGFPNDHAARAAIQMLILYMFLAVVALAAMSGQMGAAPLTIIILAQALLVRISFNCHRFPFCEIPLLLLAAALCALNARRLRRRLTISGLIPCAVFTAFSFAAHTINIAITPLIIAAWFIWVLLERAPLRRIAYVLCALAAGGLVAGLHYLKSYLDTGNPMGYGFTHYAFVGTPLWDAWQRARGFNAIRDAALFQRFLRAFANNLIGVVVPGIAASLMALGLWLKGRPGKSLGMNLFMGLIVIIGMFPLTGLADSGMVRISDMFVINPRYLQFWYPFAAMCTGMVILRLNEKDVLREAPKVPIFAALSLILFFCVRIVYSFKIPAQTINLIGFYGAHLLPFAVLALIPGILRLEKRFRWVEMRKLPSYAVPLFVLLLVVIGLASLQILFFTINPRHWLFFLAAFLIVIGPRPKHELKELGKSMVAMSAGPALIALFFLMTIVSWGAVNSWWVTETGAALVYERSVRNNFQDIMAISETLSPKYKILHDHRGTDYYLSNPSVYVFSHPAWEIVRAKNEKELRRLLVQTGIRYILLERPFGPFWGKTVMFEFLNNPGNASLLGSSKEWQFYEITTDGETDGPPENQLPGRPRNG